MTWLVYMIMTEDLFIYTGVTTDIKRRWKQHATGKGGAKFFRAKQPRQLLYIETGHDRSSAIRKEIRLKKLTHTQKWDHIIRNNPSNKAYMYKNELPVWTAGKKES
ncbi:MAG: GIY-YIG nuclease family protein [Endozoicomonas sp. (ex Botrylloides leachii)]|nr:GIY-YIG nuclease family protein [Endozoicomonas sp. (ex Botrylloides leachii)]